MNNLPTRRRFLATVLGSTAAATAMLRRPQPALGYRANERLGLAVFGNMYNAGHFLTAAHIHNADIVAVCNADQRKIPAVVNGWKEQAERLAQSDSAAQRRAVGQYERLAQRQGVEFFQDFRQMFDQLDHRIDAVIVSEVDHLHGVVCGAAMRRGKPVCSERPLGLMIEDARALRALADQTKVPTTYRSPGTGSGQFRRALELVQDGAIGEVQEVHIWFDRGGPDRDGPPKGSHVVPEELDWDLWLGPLPWREYHPDWMAYAHWRETSNGGIGTFGPHTTIFPFMALRLRELWNGDTGSTAIKVTAECSRANRVSYPRWERIRWELPARGSMPPVMITWHHGPEFAPGGRAALRSRMREFGVASDEEADDLIRTAGSMLVGTEGALVGDDHSVKITALPRDKFADIPTGAPLHLPPSHGIYVDWIAQCRGGDPHVIANFDNGGRLSELLMLGNIATQFPEQTLVYDPVAGSIAGHSEANEKLGYRYREGWKI